MKRTGQLKFKGVNLDLEIYHEPYDPPSRDMEYPGSPEENIIETIYIAGMDATELLGDKMDEIHEQFFNL
jgi:hypothetical protein